MSINTKIKFSDIYYSSNTYSQITNGEEAINLLLNNSTVPQVPVVRTSGNTTGNTIYVVNPGNDNDISSNVQAAYNVAKDGDILILPNGSFKFDLNLSFTKFVSIKGSGIGLTTLYRSSSLDDSSLLIVPMIEYVSNVDSSSNVVISDITFKSKNYLTSSAMDIGVRLIYIVDFIVTRCRFENFGEAGLYVWHKDDISRGLIYSCEFSHCYKPLIGDEGYGVDIRGDNLTWVSNAGFGTNNFIFIEDNAFEFCRHAICGDGNARYVTRYNNFTNSYIDAPINMHQARTTNDGGDLGWANYFAARAIEAYNNTISGGYFFSGTMAGQPIISGRTTDELPVCAFEICGGESLIYNNIISEYQIGINLSMDMSYFYEGSYPAHYQIGYASGLIYGSGHTGTDSLHGNGDGFFWNNTLAITLGYTPIDLAYVNDNTGTLVVLNRDYHLSAKPGYSPYTYPHPARGVVVNPTFTIGETNITTFQASGNTDYFTFKSNTNWSIVSYPSWITITSSTTGFGDGRIDLSASTNSGSQRTGIVLMSATGGLSDSIIATQLGTTSTPTLLIDKTTSSVSTIGSSITFNITSNINWGISSNQSWATVFPTSGSNNKTITITYTTNVGTNRQAIITITGTSVTSKTLTLSQDSASVSVADYYVAPNGNDNNTGTYTAPFRSIEKAYSVAVAGNLIYFRGGNYYPLTPNNQIPIYLNAGRHGTSTALIKFWAYPGETPIINLSTISYPANTNTIWGLQFTGNYWHWKGFEVTGFPNIQWQNVHQSFIARDCNNCIFELMKVYDNYSMGFELGGACDGNLVLNCDGYNNQDPLSADPYGNADGIHIGVITGLGTNNVKGCRAWNNSDDGFDSFNSSSLIIYDNCWSFHNGYIPNTETHAGDGIGFKAGGSPAAYTTVKRIYKNCLSFLNYQNGFDQNFDTGDPNTFPSYLYNCTSYKNGISGNYGVGYKFGKGLDVNILENCISYLDSGTQYSDNGHSTHNHNSWDIPLTITDPVFVSMVWSGATGSRQADGSLPNITFLHPALGANIVDAGIDVGIPYYGSKPDLGCFELLATGITLTLSVSSNALSVAVGANSTNTFNITSNTSWTVISNQTWLAVSSASGSNNAIITVTAQVNTVTSTRTATVTVAGTGVSSAIITVTQDAAAISGNVVQNLNVTNTSTAHFDLYSYQTNLAAFKNNVISAANSDDHILLIGAEATSGNNNALDGIIITGNRLTWTGADITNGNENILVGFNKNAIIKYNYIDNASYGIAVKANGMSYTSGGIAYNVFRNGFIPSAAKGIGGICWFNNTFYNSNSSGLCVYIHANQDGSPQNPSPNCEIFNNIFYTVYQINCIKVENDGSIAGFSSDYNLFYCEAGGPVFWMGGNQYSFAQWQALGYDLHSIVVNPNFINTTGLVPTSALNYGKNLGSTWITGLASNAAWGSGDPATKNQGSTWQVGAYVL